MIKKILYLLSIYLLTASFTNANPYLAGTDEVNINSPELIALAQSLNNDPVSIYNWVYNNIRYRYYQGVRKNALSVYWTKEGNSWDQSTLLIALYRISGIPTRYVFPVESPPPEGGEEAIETEDISTYENIYVEAKLSLNEARGFGGNKKRWFQLAPWVKAQSHLIHRTNYFDNQGNFIHKSKVDFNLNKGYLSKIRKESAWEAYKKKLSEYLATIGDSLKKGSLSLYQLKRTGDALPLSLPLKLNLSRIGASANIPEHFKLKITIYLDEMNGNTVNKNLLTHDVYLSQIATSRLAIDFKTRNSYNGIISDADNLTAYPVLKLDDTELKVGSATNTNKIYRYSYKIGDKNKTIRLTRPVGTFEILTFDFLNVSNKYIAKLKEELNNISVSVLSDWRTKGAYLGRYLQILSSQYLLRYKTNRNEVDRLLNTRSGMAKNGSFSINMYSDLLTKDLTYLTSNNEQEKYLIHPAINIDASIEGISTYNQFTGRPVLFTGILEKLIMYSASYQEGVIFEDWQSTTSGSTIHALMKASEDSNNKIIFSQGTDSEGRPTTIIKPQKVVSYDGITITSAKIEIGRSSMRFSYSSNSNGDNNGGSTMFKVRQQESQSYSYGGFLTRHDPTISIDYCRNDGLLGVSRNASVWSESYYEGDPVDMFSGEFYQKEKTDLSFKIAKSLDFSIKRTYRSQSDYNGTFGYGWTWNHMERLFFIDNNTIAYILNNGKSAKITLNNGTYNPPSGSKFKFSKVGGDYIIQENNGLKKTFNESGLLIKKDDSYGNYINFSYDNKYRINKMTDHLNRSFTFTYNANRKATSVTDSNGRVVYYNYYSNSDTYGAQDDLKSFTDLENNVTKYEYIVNSDNDLNNHNMSKYTLPSSDNDFLAIHYYKNDKVSHHTNAKGHTFNFQYSTKNLYSETWNEQHYYKKIFYNDKQDVIRVETKDKTLEAMTYDDDHNLLTKTDGNGNTTTYTYDDERNMLTQTDALGNITTYTYTDQDINNRTLSVRKIATKADAANNVTSYTYYATGKIKTTTQPNGNIINFTYDSNGNILTKTNNVMGDTDYKKVKYIYDANNLNLIRKTLDNSTTEYTYNQLNYQASKTKPNGATTTYEYNAFGQITKKTDDNTNDTLYEYNNNRQLTKTTQSNGAISLINYDTARDIVTQGLVKEKINPHGDKETFDYNQTGSLISKTDLNGNFTRYQYNELNRVIQTTNANGHITHYKYDGTGNKIEEKSNYIINGNSISRYKIYIYDELNRLIKIQTINSSAAFNASRSLVIYEYDNLSRKTKISNFSYENAGYALKRQEFRSYQFDNKAPNNITTYGTYTDDLGALVAGSKQVKAFTYDKLNRKTSSTNELGALTTYEYAYNTNYLTHETTTFNGKTITRSYTYNNLGKLATQTDGNNNITTHTYNNLGQKTSTTDADNHTTNYHYDTLGQLTQQVSALGHTTTYEYNLLGKFTKQTNAKGYYQSYEYDANSNITAYTNTLGFTTNYFYDTLNRKIAQIDDNQRRQSYEYDDFNNLISHTDALEFTTEYNYDLNANLIQTRQQLSDRVIITTQRYDGLSRLLQKTDGNGNTTSFKYQGIFDKPSHAIQAIDDTNSQTTQYVYNKLGQLNLTTRPDGVKEVQAHDKIGRLIYIINDWDNQRTSGSFTQYNYDNANNLIQQYDKYTPGHHILTEKTYSPTNQLLSSTIGNKTITLDYDDDNRKTSQTDALGNTTVYTYDKLNNTTSITNAKNNTIYFSYDANNNQTHHTSASGIIITQNYSDYNKLISVTQNNRTKYHEYNDQDRLIKTIDYKGNITINTYDELGRMLSQTTAKNTNDAATTYFTYDDNNNLTHLRDANTTDQSQGTFYTYDKLNRKISQTTANRKQTTYTYDSNNNLISKTLPSTDIITYEYDNQQRKTETHFNNNLAQTFTYDNLSRMISAIDYNNGQQTNTITYSYNDLGRVTSEQQNNKTVNTDYDNNQNPTIISYRPKLSTIKHYDTTNQLSKVLVNINNQNYDLADFSYNADNQLTTQALYNGTNLNLTYDNSARITNKTYSKLFNQQSSYDNNDNIIQDTI
ncbi:DUF6531 domain-containing protein, partial [Bathymodiolus thermophilus thioautotrophic gill symbiont]